MAVGPPSGLPPAAHSIGEAVRRHPTSLNAVPTSQPYDWAIQSKSYEVLSRLLDVSIASIALLLFAPIWLAVALAIKATSPGPALFKGTVIGQRGRPFVYYKFRTMISGDDSHHKRWLRVRLARRGLCPRPVQGRRRSKGDDGRQAAAPVQLGRSAPIVQRSQG